MAAVLVLAVVGAGIVWLIWIRRVSERRRSESLDAILRLRRAQTNEKQRLEELDQGVAAFSSSLARAVKALQESSTPPRDSSGSGGVFISFSALEEHLATWWTAEAIEKREGVPAMSRSSSALFYPKIGSHDATHMGFSDQPDNPEGAWLLGWLWSRVGEADMTVTSSQSPQRVKTDSTRHRSFETKHAGKRTWRRPRESWLGKISASGAPA